MANPMTTELQTKIANLSEILDKEGVERAIKAMHEVSCLATRGGCIMAIAAYLKNTRVFELLEKIDIAKKALKEIASFQGDGAASLVITAENALDTMEQNE